MGIILEDLRKREYSESFDELLAQAKELATDRDEALDILKIWILNDLSCRKSTREGKCSTDIDAKKKTENRNDKYKIVMKPHMTRDPEDEQACYPSSARNDQQMNRKQSPAYAGCSKSEEDEDECFNKHKATCSFARKKRKSRTNEDQQDYYYNHEAKAGNSMNLVETQKKEKKRRALPFDGPPPELPMEFKNKIESLHGSEAKLVIQKEIQVTDVKLHHDRLNMPRGQLLAMDFLTEQELQMVCEHCLEVRVIQPCLEETTLRLKKWNSQNGGYSFVLRTRWKDVFEKPENHIKVGNTIQVWSFRVDERGEVWFALVVYEPNEN